MKIRFPALAALLACALMAASLPSYADLVVGTGRLTLLRVNDPGTGFGPPSDFIDVEVVVKVDSQPSRAFGFQLRDDANRPAHQAMLDLLRDAFENDWVVTCVYNLEPGRNNGILIRMEVNK